LAERVGMVAPARHAMDLVKFLLDRREGGCKEFMVFHFVDSPR